AKGIFFSSNNGDYWVMKNTGLSNIEVKSIIINENNIITGTEEGVFVSYDTCNTWTLKGLSKIYINDIEIINNNVIVSTKDSAIYFSEDNFKTWRNSNIDLSFLRTNGIRKIGSILFCCTYFGIFKSTDSGKNWLTENKGLNCLQVNYLDIRDNYMVAGTNNDVFLTTDNGNLWFSKKIMEKNTVISSVKLNNSKIFTGTYKGSILSSTDNGNNWIEIFSESTLKDSGYNTTTIQCIDTYHENIFAGTYNGVIRSTVEGKSWLMSNVGLKGIQVNSLLIQNNDIFAGTRNGIYISSDTGSTWELIYSKNYINSLSSYKNIMLAGFASWSYNSDFYPGGVCLSTDYGKTWIDLNINISFMTVNDVKVYENYYFLGSNQGVFLSRDSGKTWFEVNDGLTDININSMSINSENVYAGTYGAGVFKAGLNNFFDSNIKDISAEYEEIRIIPNPATDFILIKSIIKESYHNSMEYMNFYIIDMLGNIVRYQNFKLYEFEDNFVRIDISDLSSGIYFIKLGDKIQKLLKI
ncbi:MAG: hypothetical protein QG635_1122, partial [Bacteroidota bacterium]|nr:hypothetical protein [Bacteroidota bacterium]